MPRSSRPAAPRYLALTGTPGTGKSRGAQAIGPGFGSVEVGELALEHGFGRRTGRSTEVDLERLSGWLRRQPPPDRPTFVVGHLAHLLPIREVVVLRCHPLVLLERLRRARRGRGIDRRENAVSEALDQILVEALELGRSVREIDTTGRTVGSVAREIARSVEGRLVPRTGTVDWLSDPSVTDFLLREPP